MKHTPVILRLKGFKYEARVSANDVCKQIGDSAKGVRGTLPNTVPRHYSARCSKRYPLLDYGPLPRLKSMQINATDLTDLNAHQKDISLVLQ